MNSVLVRPTVSFLFQGSELGDASLEKSKNQFSLHCDMETAEN